MRTGEGTQMARIGISPTAADELLRIAEQQADQEEREARAWLARLRMAHDGGYHIVDATVDTVIRNCTVFERIINGLRRG